MCCHYCISDQRLNRVFFSSICTSLDKKTLLKILLNPGLKLTVFRGTGPRRSAWEGENHYKETFLYTQLNEMETLLTNRRGTKLELEYWNVEVGAGEGGEDGLYFADLIYKFSQGSSIFVVSVIESILPSTWRDGVLNSVA